MKNIVCALLVCGVVACSASDASQDSSGESTDALSELSVRDHVLNAREDKWLRYVATEVVPDLRGSRDERLTVAARGAWWAMKEGDWEAENAAGYSLCHRSSGDHRLGPLDTCGSGEAWQVGVAGVQVPGHSVADLEALSKKLYPNIAIDALLERAATLAGYQAGGDTSRSIIASEGALRASWLLRVPAIGFTVVENSEVTPECIVGSKHWCYGTTWDETRKFAPSRAAAHAAIADVRTLLVRLAP